MVSIASIFDRRVEFDPAADFETFRLSAPAKWAVYLLADENDRPVQLLCVKNLRYSLERRLGVQPADAEPSKRVDYREIVRRVYWRRVDSAFEADVVYLEAARLLFPQTYRGMVGLRPAWFVHVNSATTYPRYIKTNDPTRHTGEYFGPIEDKHAAHRYVHTVESLFDLCRDYSIFVQSPSAGPCPWKQMGKCVGPCDGTVSLDAYRQLIAYSAEVLADPESYIEDQSQRMQQAAGELKFETAAKIKTLIEQVSQLTKSAFRYVRPIERFNFVALQTGPRNGTAKVFLTTGGHIEHIASLINEPQHSSDLLELLLQLAQERRGETIDDIGTENIGIVSHHLFTAKAAHGAFIPLDTIDERSFLKGYRDLLKQKPAAEPIGEGVTRELQAL